MLNFRLFSAQRSKPIAPVERVLAIGAGEYRLCIRRNPRAKSITLRTDPARAALLVTMPPYASEAQMLAFVRSKSAWIEASFARTGPRTQLQPGEAVMIGGVSHIIRWAAEWPRTVRISNGEIRVGGPLANVPKRILAWLKRAARTALSADLVHYCARAGVDAVPPLRLSNARRRWGSCSASGDIRINWRLVMAPEYVRQSVVAHEVAHLRHMNHSAAFYGWLDTIYDDSRSCADAWLKEYGSALYAVQTD